jgi:hypothetical protein
MGKDMKTQDKEFDDLFRAKLDGFEMEPHAQVWENIEAELTGKKDKKSIFPMLRIAASIIILVTAGILFIPKKKAVKPGRPDKNNVAVNQVKSSGVKPVDNTRVITPVTKGEPAVKVQGPVNRIAGIRHTKKTVAPATQNTQDIQQIAKAKAVKADEQPILAAVSTKADETEQPITLAAETPVTIKQDDTHEMPGVQSQPILASTPTPASKTVKPVVKKHGIRNFGDLVNLVVARVDKRKDKVIEFTDTDDDQTTITGVHFGAIRIKKDN